jgi:hypothetical protein
VLLKRLVGGIGDYKVDRARRETAQPFDGIYAG